MFEFFKSLVEKKPPFRLVPDVHGTYTLERWNDRCSDYVSEVFLCTKEKADEYIKNLDRETLYYIEGEKS